MNEAQGNLAALESYASSKETYVSSGNFNDWTIQLDQVDITAPKISKPSQGNDGNGGNGEPILIAANPNQAGIGNDPMLSSKGGRQNIRDDGLRDVNDEQLQQQLDNARKYKNKELIQRLQKEEKARKLRNVQKRNNITQPDPDNPIFNNPIITPGRVVGTGLGAVVILIIQYWWVPVIAL
jgi:hypothetical protein